MGELIKKIFDFFENKALSMSKKVTMLVFVILLFLFVDNHCGFSYYFVQSYKLDYITSLEDARVKYANDRVVSQELDRMMVNALNRWTVYNAVSDIFQRTFSTTSEAREQKLVKEITKERIEETPKKIEKKDGNYGLFSRFFPIAERSPFWHTICSSFILVVFLLICIIYLFCSPFIHDTNKRNAILGMCVIIPILIGMIFLTQWLFSFIPDIASRPRINNLIYISVNIFVLILMKKKIKKK